MNQLCRKFKWNNKIADTKHRTQLLGKTHLPKRYLMSFDRAKLHKMQVATSLNV